MPKTIKEHTQRITVRLPERLLEAVKVEAKSCGKTVADVVRRCLSVQFAV